MKNKQKKILEKERKEYPAECALIDLIDACGGYEEDLK